MMDANRVCGGDDSFRLRKHERSASLTAGIILKRSRRDGFFFFFLGFGWWTARLQQAEWVGNQGVIALVAVNEQPCICWHPVDCLEATQLELELEKRWLATDFLFQNSCLKQLICWHLSQTLLMVVEHFLQCAKMTEWKLKYCICFIELENTDKMEHWYFDRIKKQNVMASAGRNGKLLLLRKIKRSKQTSSVETWNWILLPGWCTLPLQDLFIT